LAHEEAGSYPSCGAAFLFRCGCFGSLRTARCAEWILGGALVERGRVNFAGAWIAALGVLLLALVDHLFAGSLGAGARTLSVLGAAALGSVLLVPIFWGAAALLARPLARPWLFRVEVFALAAFWCEALWSLAFYLRNPRLPLVIGQLYLYAYGVVPSLVAGFLLARARFARAPTPSRQAWVRAGLLVLSVWGLWWNPHFRQYPSQLATASAMALFTLLLTRPLAWRPGWGNVSAALLLVAALFGAFYVGTSPGRRDQAARGGRLTRLLLRAATPLLRPFGQSLEQLAASSAIAPPPRSAPSQPPHRLETALAASKPARVLLITVDALRADFGGLRENETLQKLLSESVVFTQARSTASNTIESMTSIFLGRYYFTGIKGLSLPKLFQQSGFFTINVQPIAFLNVRGGHKWVEKDFDFFVGTMTYKYALAPNSDQMTDAMLHALGNANDRPFFAWMHYNDPHHPYDAEGDSNPERYRNEVDATFREIGRLLREMESRGLLANTMVVLSADHGEEFGEHGGATHSLTIYDEVTRVPLIIRAPGGSVRGTYDELTSLVGLAPALLRWTGAKDSPEFAPARRDLFAGSHVPVFAFRRVEHGFGFGDAAVTLGRYKLLYSFEVEAAQLYDVETDPGEANNLADEHPEKMRELAALLWAEAERASSW
jgi:Sulfatase